MIKVINHVAINHAINSVLFLFFITINSNVISVTDDLSHKEISAILGLVEIIKLSKEFKCTYCDSSFANKNQLKHHMRCCCTEKPNKCKLCSKSYCSQKNLDRHTKSKHS